MLRSGTITESCTADGSRRFHPASQLAEPIIRSAYSIVSSHGRTATTFAVVEIRSKLSSNRRLEEASPNCEGHVDVRLNRMEDGSETRVR
jgi:hypothetical protein